MMILKIKKQLVGAFLLLLLSLPAWSYKIGIGFDENKTLLLPLRLTDGLMLEFFYERENSSKHYGETIITKDYSALGLGVFGFIQAKHSMEYYYGMRVSKPFYEIEKSVYSDSEKSTFKGISLSSAIGAQYNFNEYLSLSLEAFYDYSFGQLESSIISYSTNRVSNPSYTDLSRHGLSTRILARLMF